MLKTFDIRCKECDRYEFQFYISIMGQTPDMRLKCMHCGNIEHIHSDDMQVFVVC